MLVISRDRPALSVFGRTWAYDRYFWQGVLGSLSMVVGVARKPESCVEDVNSLEASERLCIPNCKSDTRNEMTLSAEELRSDS